MPLFLLLPWAGENGHLLSSLALVGMGRKGAGLRTPSLLPPALRRLEKLRVEKLPPQPQQRNSTLGGTNNIIVYLKIALRVHLNMSSIQVQAWEGKRCC